MLRLTCRGLPRRGLGGLAGLGLGLAGLGLSHTLVMDIPSISVSDCGDTELEK